MSLILVIEDTDALRDEIADILGFEGFEVETAENGRIGLERAAALRPDLIVCDVMMPEMDGYEVVTALRANPDLATTPCVLLTARAERNDVRRGMAAGADDYLTKPFGAEELMTAVRAALAKRARVILESERQVEDLRQQISLSLPHEIRTPLVAVLGYAELMQEADTGLTLEDCRTMAGKIHLAAERLHRLTENFVLYAQLELLRCSPQRGRLGRNARTDLRVVGPLVQGIANAYGRSSDLHLDLHPTFVAVEETHLCKLVRELVDNAFKFSPAGTIVSVQATAGSDHGLLLVVDGGHGMTAEQIEQVGAFTQFDREVKEQQGMGLGLAISQRIAELCGGSLSIAAEERGGVSVHVSLPLTDHLRTAAPLPSPP